MDGITCDLVAPHGWVYLERPGVDAAGHRLDIVEAVPREVRSRIEAPLPEVAVEDDGRVLGPVHHHLHQRLGNERGALDPSHLPLLGRSHVDEAGGDVSTPKRRHPLGAPLYPPVHLPPALNINPNPSQAAHGFTMRPPLFAFLQ